MEPDRFVTRAVAYDLRQQRIKRQPKRFSEPPPRRAEKSEYELFGDVTDKNALESEFGGRNK